MLPRCAGWAPPPWDRCQLSKGGAPLLAARQLLAARRTCRMLLDAVCKASLTPGTSGLGFEPTTPGRWPGSWRLRWRRCWACRTCGATCARRRAASALCSGRATRLSRGACGAALYPNPPRSSPSLRATLVPPSCANRQRGTIKQVHRAATHLPHACPVCMSLCPVAAGSAVWDARRQPTGPPRSGPTLDRDRRPGRRQGGV